MVFFPTKTKLFRCLDVLYHHFSQNEVPLQMMGVLNAFSLAFTCSNTFGIALWRYLNKLKTSTQKQGKDILCSSNQVDVLDINKTPLILKAVKLLPRALLFCTLSEKRQEVILSLWPE